ncbi:MAG: formylmethanofuran dehydrogenase subunit B [Candidatus Bathyarchaeia archaeon]|nr:formylmethanofuran dehydrogenase subunit B [Candidatus Bathyarchaeota archaeon]
MEETIHNVVCTVCGCCCDDLEVKIKDGRIVEVKNACAVSLSKFQNYNNEERIVKPMIKKNGEFKECSFEEAIKEASIILAESEYPLIYGLSLTTTEAISKAVELAEALGGVIDNTTSVCHGPSLIGVHDIGVVTCTLGEVKNRADLIIYWGSNPVFSHPRHLTRYTVFSKGKFRKERKERKLIVVDVRRTATAKMADIFIQVAPNQDYELLSALRMAIKGEEIYLDEVAGVPVNKIEELADLMVSCEFGILFFGLGLTMSLGKSRNIDAALSLVRDLNEKTKFLIMPMRGHYNVTGANEAIAWQTGYPFAVDFSQGYPRYNPGETTIIDILNRGECDAALIIGSDPAAHFPVSAIKHLTKIPVIIIDPHKNATTLISKVVIPTAITGIEAEGTVYRMDGVPLECKKLVEPPSGLKSDEEILTEILMSVKKLKGEEKLYE